MRKGYRRSRVTGAKFEARKISVFFIHFRRQQSAHNTFSAGNQEELKILWVIFTFTDFIGLLSSSSSLPILLRFLLCLLFFFLFISLLSTYLFFLLFLIVRSYIVLFRSLLVIISVFSWYLLLLLFSFSSIFILYRPLQSSRTRSS